LLAHQEERFQLSIPIFLIHIEAFFDHLFTDTKWDTKRKRKKLEQVVTEEAQKNKVSEHFMKSSFLFHITRDVMRKLEEGENTDFPNRHKILHGENLEYYKDRLNSTKCIILLDAIAGLNIDDYRVKVKELSQNGLPLQ
jgi:hypothetical protein